MRGLVVNGEVLKKWRQGNGFTQEMFAHQVECDVKTLRRAERGDRIDVATVRRIAEVMRCPLDSIVHEDVDTENVAKRNEQLFLDWQAVYNRRDVDELLKFYHDDATLLIAGAEDLPAGGKFVGKEAVRDLFVTAFDSFLTDEIQPHEYRIHVAGDLVFVRLKLSAVVRATGQRFSASIVIELEIRDKQILRQTFVLDTAVIRDALTHQEPPSSS